MTNEALLYEKVGDHIALVTINRPNARNAVDADVTQGLSAALVASEADEDIWVVILTGAGEQAFCAGADLKAVAAGEARSLSTMDGGFAGFTNAKRGKIWIAAVNGAALAGGCELVLACDLVVASQAAKFGVPEVKRGLVALAGGVFRLPRALPKAVAIELIATGGTLTAQRAHELGLVNRLAPVDELARSALDLAKEICCNAPLAVRESLLVARKAYDLPESELWNLSAEAGRRIFASEDIKEGPRAFIEKRPPRWIGR